MRLPRLAIENHQFALVFLLLLVGIGVTSVFSMPRAEDPQISPPGSTVVALFPGASPEEIEQLVVDPVEDSLNELDDIKRLAASIEDGLATIEIEFVNGSDADDKYKLVVERVNRVRNDMPEGLALLDVSQWSITQVAIMQLALVSQDMAYARLDRLAGDLESRIERIPGVKGADVWACPEQQIHVIMGLERMAQLHIGMPQLFGAIKSANANIPGGAVEIGPKKLNVRTTGSFDDVAQIESTVVASRAGYPIRVRDVATVAYGYEAANHLGRVNGERAVFVTVKQKADTNIMHIAEDLRNTVSTFERELPEGVRLAVVFDQAESVASRTSDFATNLLMGVGLVFLVMFFSLGLRASIIVALVIPAAVAISLGWIDMAGFAIEQMTISGLVIALGLLVDNGIVVTESIARFLRMGSERVTAAIEGAREVAWPIISSTITTVLAFLPITLLDSITGDFIRGMPATVIATLTASLLLALTLTPLVASRLMSRAEAERGGLVQPFIDDVASGAYPRLLDVALRRPKTTITLAVLALAGSLALAGRIGVSFFPKAEKPQFFVNVDLPQGSNLDTTDTAARYVEGVLAQRDDVEIVATNVGRGNPRVYYNVIPKHETATHAQLLVKLDSYHPEQLAAVVDELREQFATYPGAKIEVKELQQGPPVEAPIAIKVLGERLADITNASSRVEEAIAKVPGVVNVGNPLRTAATDLRVVVNRDKAAKLGFALSDVDAAIRASLAGWTVTALRDANGDEIDIVARATETSRPRHDALDKIALVAPNGARVPLGQLARVELERGPARIYHVDLERAATVTADVRTGFNVAAVTEEVVRELSQQKWPRGIDFRIAGEQEERQDSFGGMQKALLLAVLGILAVLVLQFRSFAQPLIVFVAVPLAAVGSIGALWITGYSFSFTAFVGFTSLVGIGVNNSIILLDYANRMRLKGMSVDDAIRAAGRTRLVPILLTTATTIGGLLPLTLRGGTLWAPMGWTIIGGLLVSTLLTLVVVPVLYSMLGRVADAAAIATGVARQRG